MEREVFRELALLAIFLNVGHEYEVLETSKNAQIGGWIFYFKTIRMKKSFRRLYWAATGFCYTRVRVGGEE